MYRHLVVIAAAAALAAPAVAQTTAAAPSDCSIVAEGRRQKRPADARRDSVRSAITDELRDEARRAARAAGVAEPGGLAYFRLENRRRGEATLAQHGSNVADEVLLRALERVRPRLAEWPDRDPVRVAVRLDSLDAAEPDDTAVECEPELLNRGELRTAVERYMQSRSTGAIPFASDNRHVLRVVVTRDGAVVFPEVERRSRDPHVDAFVLSLAGEMRFRPASIGGKPVDAWVTLPIQMRMPEERSVSSQ